MCIVVSSSECTDFTVDTAKMLIHFVKMVYQWWWGGGQLPHKKTKLYIDNDLYYGILF